MATPSKTSSLPKMQRTSSMKNPYGTVLAYGPAGSGKTFSIKTLIAAGFKPFGIITELGRTGGLLSVTEADIPFVQVHNHAETIDVIQALKRKPGKIEYEQEEFNAVVLDSITQWAEYPLDRYMELKGWDDLHGVTVKGEGKDPRTAYGFLAEKGRSLYKALFELEGHLYIIAREGLFQDEAGTIFAAPELPGQKLPREVPGWPDATVRLRVIAAKHRMITKGEGGSPARIRYPGNFPQLPLRCLPDIGALIKFICGDASQSAALTPPDAPQEPKAGQVTATLSVAKAPSK